MPLTYKQAEKLQAGLLARFNVKSDYKFSVHELIVECGNTRGMVDFVSDYVNGFFQAIKL